MKDKNCTIYSIRRVGKTFNFVSKILKLEEPYTVVVIYKNDPQIRYMKKYIKDNLPFGVKIKWIKYDEVRPPSLKEMIL